MIIWRSYSPIVVVGWPSWTSNQKVTLHWRDKEKNNNTYIGYPYVPYSILVLILLQFPDQVSFPIPELIQSWVSFLTLSLLISKQTRN